MTQQWYFEMDGRQGPLEPDRLVDLKLDGLITDATECTLEDRTAPYARWEELTTLEARLLEARRTEKARTTPSTAAASPHRSPGSGATGLADQIRAIERRNRTVAGSTLLIAGVLAFVVAQLPALMAFKLKDRRGDLYLGATFGLPGVGCGDKPCPIRPVDEEAMEEAGLEYRDKLPLIGFDTFRIAGRVAFFSALLLGLMLLLSGGLMLGTLARPGLQGKALLVNHLSLLPFVVLVVGCAVFLLGGLANLGEGGVAHVAAGTGARLDGVMRPTQELIVAGVQLACTITGYVYTHKIHGT